MKSIIIHDWMLRHPSLSGYKLLIFAVIYYFSSLGSGCFMSVSSWLKLLDCSRSQFFKARSDLISCGLIKFAGSPVGLFCCDLSGRLTITTPSGVCDSYPDTQDALMSWEEVMELLTKDDSDNETVVSDNETVVSDNETLSF